jgi:hypothetical protein
MKDKEPPMRHRTEITIETDRTVFVSRRRRFGPDGWCGVCRAPARLIALDEAASLLRVHAQTVRRLVEAAGFHYVETDGGPPLICFGAVAARPPAAAITKSFSPGV